MQNPIAVIHVTVQTDSTMSGSQELKRLYKVGVLPEDEALGDEETAALFEYNGGGYRFLEALGDNSPDVAIEEAKTRIPDYVLNDEVLDITVTRRE